jgi:20S proteasome alpha/beta subunit
LPVFLVPISKVAPAWAPDGAGLTLLVVPFWPPIPPKKPIATTVKNKRYLRRMTIALGILCSDGVVLATDTQYSVGTVLKYEGLKLFRASAGDCQVIIAACNNADAFRRVIDVIQEELQRSLKDTQPTVDIVRLATEGALAKFYRKFIDPIPSDERANFEFQLIVGICAKSEKGRLFHSNRSMLVEDYHCACLGEGQYIAEYAIELFVPLKPSVELSKCLAAYIVSAAKRYIQSVGGQSKVYAIHNDGSDSVLLPFEIEEVEECFGQIIPAFHFALSGLAVGSFPDLLFNENQNPPRSVIARFREKKAERLKKHREWLDGLHAAERERHLKIIDQEVQPNPKPSKHARKPRRP